jgi:hypothetical protein
MAADEKLVALYTDTLILRVLVLEIEPQFHFE